MNKKYIIPGDDVDSLGIASSDTKKILKSLGIAPEILKRVAVSMYEAEINTAIHGGGGVGTVAIDKEGITIEFIDEGPGIPDIALAMTEGFSTAPLMARKLGFGAGMGLPNIEKNCTKLDLDSAPGKGTKITIFIKLS